MPEGEIKFVISGDSSKYENELNRIRSMSDETRDRIDNLYRELLKKNIITDSMVKDTIDKTETELTKVRSSIKEESEEIAKVDIKLQESEVELINVRTNIKEQSVELDNLEIKRKETEARVKFTVSGMLLGLRAVTDIAALVAITTGEQIDVQFLSMISFSITALMQVQLQAAVYAATPGMQPFAMMMLALIPMLTGMIGFIKAQEMKVQAQIDKAHQNQLDALLDGVSI